MMAVLSRGNLKKLVPLALSVMMLPVGLMAQAPPPTPVAASQLVVFGNGLQTPLRFAGESIPTNQISLSMGATGFYDDNVLQRNSLRIADEGVNFNSDLTFLRQTENVTFSFDYQPAFFLYNNTKQLDRLNHLGTLNLTFRLSTRWNVGLYDTISYQNGAFQSLTAQQITSGLSSPTALNQSLIPYNIRTLANTSGLNLTFVKSHRTSFTLSGNFDARQFGSQQIVGQSLYNNREASGGFQYQYRVTEHTSFGLVLLHQDSTYKGGTGFGSDRRFQNESVFASVESHVAPTVTLALFGGPQYVSLFGQSASGGVLRQFQGAGGGSITKEVKRTALDLSLQRVASDSGGLYTMVENTSVTFGVRRRLVGRWEAGLQGGAARADTSLLQLGKGRVDSLQGGFDLMRPLSNGATFRVSYLNAHQLTSGTLPISVNYDRDLVTVAIDFRLKAIPLGH
jgi:hypothetical protein